MNVSKLQEIAKKHVDCPLCLLPFDLDDHNFFPCSCGYQICRFCWDRITSTDKKLCPDCSKEYSENPANFKPLTKVEVATIRAHQHKDEIIERRNVNACRKYLTDVRVVQKNLVLIVGIPQRIANPNILKQHKYFGKFGKIDKVVINCIKKNADFQLSAYVTFANSNDALRAIITVNKAIIDGRPVRTCLGTCKYCLYFVKNQPCSKKNCAFLHKLGDPEATFTQDDLKEGKHRLYSKRLLADIKQKLDAQAAKAAAQADTCGWVTPVKTTFLAQKDDDNNARDAETATTSTNSTKRITNATN